MNSEEKILDTFQEVKNKLTQILGEIPKQFKESKEGVAFLTYLAVAVNCIDDAETIIVMNDE